MLSTKEIVKKAIQALTTEVLSSTQGLQRSANEAELFGLTDAEQTINEYLENNELGLALDHLNYVILEIGIDLVPNQIERIHKIEEKLEVSYTWMAKPSGAETSACYRLIESFNQRQKEVVQILQDLWEVKFPMTNMDWVHWHHQTSKANVPYEKKGIRIFPHGYGLSMRTSEFWIDFDFGEAGEIDGFDAGRLLEYNEKNKVVNDLKSFDQIQNIIDQEVEKEKLKYSGYVSYYKS